MAEQSSSNLLKSIIGQLEALIEKEHQKASKLQILEDINREATEIVEGQHCRLEEARLNLITPLTSEIEASEADNYGGTRPKTTSRVTLTSAALGVLPQEGVAQTYSNHSKSRQEQQLEDHAALLRDEIFNGTPGTVNTPHGTASKIGKLKVAVEQVMMRYSICLKYLICHWQAVAIGIR